MLLPDHVADLHMMSLPSDAAVRKKNADGGQEVIFLTDEAKEALITPVFCVALDRSSRGTESFLSSGRGLLFAKGENRRKLTEKKKQTLFILHLRSGDAESDNAACVCGDRFVKLALRGFVYVTSQTRRHSSRGYELAKR